VVECEGRLVAGVIYNPILGEYYTAALGDGAFLNGKPIHVSKASEPGRSMVVTGFPYKREGRVEEVLKPLRTVVKDYEGFRRLGSAAMDLAYVAAGKCDVFYEESLKPWDTAAGVVLVTEAGGRVTDYAGEPFRLEENNILATNGILHDGFVDVLKDVNIP
jgi:myo-inositol-1(or 4)-monophosphatase